VNGLIRTLMRHPFVRFACVGGAGYVVNAGVLAFDTDVLRLGFEPGLAFAIFISMCFTWIGNRYLTFAGQRARGPKGMAQEWLKFMGANAVGAVVNYAVGVAVMHFAAHPFDNKYIAQACGVLAGLVFNFTLSKKLVFRA
jgi:putative flippase GtrA